MKNLTSHLDPLKKSITLTENRFDRAVGFSIFSTRFAFLHTFSFSSTELLKISVSCNNNKWLCMHNLYRSVENLEEKYFSYGKCKTMLLHTRNSSADMCRKLKVNNDYTEPLKYYTCPNFSNSHVSEGLLSTFCEARCGCDNISCEEKILSTVECDNELK